MLSHFPLFLGGRVCDRLLQVCVQPRARRVRDGSEQLRPQHESGSVLRAELLLPPCGGRSIQTEETGEGFPFILIFKKTKEHLEKHSHLVFFPQIDSVFDGCCEERDPTEKSKTSIRPDHLHRQSGSADVQTWCVTLTTRHVYP